MMLPDDTMNDEPRAVPFHRSIAERPLFFGVGIELLAACIAAVCFSLFIAGFSLITFVVVLVCAGLIYGVRAILKKNPFGIAEFFLSVVAPPRFVASNDPRDPPPPRRETFPNKTIR